MSQSPARRFTHKSHIVSFGFTERDWLRITALADSAPRPSGYFSLDDLDAPWRVLACPIAEAHSNPGVIFAAHGDVALLAWPRDALRRLATKQVAP